MSSASYALVLAVAGALTLSGASVAAQPYPYRPQLSAVQVDVDVFYEGLAPHGEWIETPDYGWSWAPRVERGWRPYTRGQWVMTDYGWYWDSDEQFGWATYHYGRWVNDPYYGWFWIPGTDWAPAWVSWRRGNGYTGWAPLPPRATWRTRVGLSLGSLELDAFIGSSDYTFVHDRAFVDRGIYQRALPPEQNLTIIHGTRNVTHYTLVDERVVDRGIALASVERSVGRRVARQRTVELDRHDGPRRAGAGEVPVFRPQVRAAPGRRPSQGRSLVRGEAPSPLLLERRREREQERQRRGNVAEVSARDAEQQRPVARQPAARQPVPRVEHQNQQTDERRHRPQARQPAEKPSDENKPRARRDGREAEADEAQRAKDGRRQAPAPDKGNGRGKRKPRPPV